VAFDFLISGGDDQSVHLKESRDSYIHKVQEIFNTKFRESSSCYSIYILSLVTWYTNVEECWFL